MQIDDTTKALYAEYLRRCVYKQLTPYDDLFLQQRQFAFDSSRYKVALCTRRAGKTHTAAACLVEAALKYNNVLCPYIGLTRDSSKRILWPVLLSMKEKYKLDAEMQEASLTMIFGNKSQIFIVGADQNNFINRLKGPKYKRVVIDEAQAFKEHLQDLVDEVITPALIDQMGDLLVMGTPGLRPSGFFYDITTKDKGFSKHHWSVLNNPHIPNVKEFIVDMMKRRGWTTQNPTYRREWLGEWVLDLDAQLIKFHKDRHIYSQKPEAYQWNCVMGIDIGFNDKTAFVVVSYSDQTNKVYVEHSEAHSEMIPSQMAIRAQQLIDRFSPVKIVADTGGLGKSIVEELRQRYGLAILPAEKKHKLTNISFLNGCFIDGRIFVKSDLDSLIYQLETVVKGDDGLEDPQSECDEIDALLYAFMETKAHTFSPKPAKIDPNSDEWAQKILEDEESRYQTNSHESYDGWAMPDD